MMQSSVIGTDTDPIDLMRAIVEKRDRSAFAIVFDSYAPKLKAFLIRGGLDRGTAEELVQEIMLTVWQRAGSFDPARGGLSTWIFTIARNRRIDHFRRLQRMAEDGALGEPPPEAELAVDNLVEREESHISLRAALKSLPPEQAEVLRLAFFEQKPHSAIASERKLPLGTVKSRIRLALRALRRVLEAER
jgi:RNA polymerase sigma factor (sigma-70 family)